MLLHNRHTLWLRLLFALGAMALFVFSYQWGNQQQRAGSQPPLIDGVLIRPPGAVPRFELRDPFGQVFDQDRLADGWTLMAFGALSDASGQRVVARLIDVYNRVADQPTLRKSLKLVLVTTVETPARSRDFARLSPALHILAGEDADIARVRETLGGADGAQPTLFMFAPGAHLIALFPPTEAGSAVAEDLKTLFTNASALLPESSL